MPAGQMSFYRINKNEITKCNFLIACMDCHGNNLLWRTSSLLQSQECNINRSVKSQSYATDSKEWFRTG